MDRAGGRKMVLSMAVMMVGLSVDLTVGLSENMLKLMMLALGAFVLGNIGEHCFAAFRKRRTSASTQAINQVKEVAGDLDTIREELKRIADGQAQLAEAASQLSQGGGQELPEEFLVQLQASNNQGALLSKGMTQLLSKTDQLLDIASSR